MSAKKKLKKPKTKLFEVVIKQYKVFYIEAESQLDALNSELVEDEEQSSFGEFDWEHDETSAKECSPEFAEATRARHPEMILKDDGI